MRRSLSGILAATLISTMLFPILAGAEGQNQIEEIDSLNERVSTSDIKAPGEGINPMSVLITDGPRLIQDKVAVELAGASEEKAVLIVVSKEDGSIKQIDFDKTENVSEKNLLSVAAPTTEDYEILLWNSFEEMTPLMPVITKLEGLPYVPGRVRDRSLELEDGYTASDYSAFMVKEVSAGMNNEGDIIYTIKAAENGAEIEYVTSTVTSVSKSRDNSPIFSSIRRYSYELLWDAVSEWKGETTVRFEEIVNPGDVFTAKKEGNTLLYMLKVGDASHIELNGNVNWSNTGKLSQMTLNRDGWSFGQIKRIEIEEDSAVVTSGLTEDVIWALDINKKIDVYEITYEIGENGEKKIIRQTIAENAIVPQDFVPYDEATGEGDMVLTRIFKGSMRENYVYRFIKNMPNK